MFSNKETVSCFYCQWTCWKDKLASHSNAYHPSSKVLNSLRKEKVEQIPMSYEQHKILPCVFSLYFVSNKVDLRAEDKTAWGNF
jgi:hypothetical protein